MKNIVITSVLIFAMVFANAQENEYNKEIKTLFGSTNSHGGYGALTFNYSPINGEDGIFMGGRGCWVIGHGLAIGLGGGGLINNYSYDYGLMDDYHYEAGYGGLIIEPIVFGRFPIHLSFPVLLGVGGVAYASRYYETWDGTTHDIEDVDAFLVAEPGAEVELNIMKHFRMSFGVYYRYTSEINLYNSPTDVLNGLSAGFTMKFGKF